MAVSNQMKDHRRPGKCLRRTNILVAASRERGALESANIQRERLARCSVTEFPNGTYLWKVVDFERFGDVGVHRIFESMCHHLCAPDSADSVRDEALFFAKRRPSESWFSFYSTVIERARSPIW